MTACVSDRQQDVPPERRPLWPKDYFEQTVTEKNQTPGKLSALSLFT